MILRNSPGEERDTKDTLSSAKGDLPPHFSGVTMKALERNIWELWLWQHWQLFLFPFLFFSPRPLPFFSRAETRPWWESSQNCCRFKDLPSNPLNATCGTILAKALEAKINYVSVPSEAQDGYSHKIKRKKMSTSRYNQCNPGPSNISKDHDKHNTTLWILSHVFFHCNACKIAIWKKKERKIAGIFSRAAIFTSLSSLASFLECRVLTWGFIFVGQHIKLQWGGAVTLWDEAK